MGRPVHNIKKWAIIALSAGVISALAFFMVMMAALVQLAANDGEKIGGTISITGTIEGEDAEFEISGAVNAAGIKTPKDVTLDEDDAEIDYSGFGSIHGVSSGDFTPTDPQLDTARAVYDKLIEEGFTSQAACGVLGNIQAKSGFDPGAIEGGNGIGAGLFQWSYGRRDALEKFAEEQGKSWKNVSVQTDFLIYELETDNAWKQQLKNCHAVGISALYCDQIFGVTHPQWNLDKFKACGDIKKAAVIFCNHFERPGIPALNNRIKYAAGYYEAICTTAELAVTVKLHGKRGSGNAYSFSGTINGQKIETSGTITGAGGKSEISTHGTIGNISMESGDLLSIARTQMGTIGGDTYRKWYTGYADGAAWCATFVSWCANKCGYIENGLIPKFAYVPDGVTWFNQRGRWKARDEIPAPGDLIFFDYNGNGSADHVGFVEVVEGGRITTIEGNTNTSSVSAGQVDSHIYEVGQGSIFGFGVLNTGGTENDL